MCIPTTMLAAILHCNIALWARTVDTQIYYPGQQERYTHESSRYQFWKNGSCAQESCVDWWHSCAHSTAQWNKWLQEKAYYKTAHEMHASMSVQTVQTFRHSDNGKAEPKGHWETNTCTGNWGKSQCILKFDTRLASSPGKYSKSIVGTATSYGMGGRGVGVRVPVEARFFSSAHHPDSL
jgi:hypothetical protein